MNNQEQPTNSYRWTVLGIIMVGTFSAMINASVVNVALPRMMSTFGVNRDQIEWVTTGFMLATAVTVPVVGYMIGRLGFKTLYLSALALFMFSSGACALSWSYDTLIIARIFQAIGAGGMQPVGMAIVASLFEPHERGKAIGIWSTGIMLGPTIGPTLGGYLTDWFSWRTVFSVNVPFSLGALLAGLAIMRSETAAERVRIPFDLWGYLFLAMALIGGLLGLSKGQAMGWSSAYIRICFACTIVGLVMFVAIESSVTHPLLDLSLLRFRNYSLSMVLAIFRSVGLFGGMFLLPIFLQNLAGYTPIQAGLWMMPGAVTMGIMMPFAGRLADRVNNPRYLVATGTIITGFSMFLYARLDPLSGITMIIGPQVIRAFGLAFMMTPLITAAINAVPLARVAMASSFLNVTQQVGGSFGIAILNTYVTKAIHGHTVRLGEIISTQSVPFQQLTAHVSEVITRQSQGMSSSATTSSLLMETVSRHVHDLPATEYISSLLMAVRIISQKASVMGFDSGFVVGGLIVLSGLPLCLMLKPGWHQSGGQAGAPPRQD